MDTIEEEILTGGLMNSPKKFGDVIHRVQTPSTNTIHRLLKHVRFSGITWVPEPKGIIEGHEILSYISGYVPHDMPDWIWDSKVLSQVAGYLREWHDATIDFDKNDAIWSFNTNTSHEVICHNDFAPYNCVFNKLDMVGLIDFDLCAPGSRLWDMAYTAYRYIPVMPFERTNENFEISPFNKKEQLARLNEFLDSYSKNELKLRYSIIDLLQAMCDRLNAISEWTESYANKTANLALMENSKMYKQHSRWINNEFL